MTAEAWVALGVVALVIGLLAFTRAPAEFVLAGGLALLLVLKVVPTADALSGFANEGVVIIGVLFVVAAGLRHTGTMTLLMRPVLGRPRSVLAAHLRLLPSVALISAFVENTPVTAVMLPVVNDWARRNRLSPSMVMMPLGFAVILGGLVTLLGTSVNLVVNGLVVRAGRAPLGVFEQTWVGLPCCLAGLAYLIVASRWLLPQRRPAAAEPEDPRNYTVEMVVAPGSPLAGRTIEQAGLRHLPGLYLMEIERAGEILAAVGSETRLAAGDRLVFVGVVASVVDLQKVRGLKPATDQVFKLDAPRAQRWLIEAVVSNTCPLVGSTIRAGRFRSVYNAAVIAVARNGERLRGKIGDVVLRPGDTLLLEAHPSFVESQHDSRDFYLVSRVEGWAPPRHDRAGVALLILLGMVLSAGLGWLSMFTAAVVAAAAMILTRCCTPAQARQSIEWHVLVVIGCAFGLGRALDVTGAAGSIARGMVGLAGSDPWLALALVYAVTMLFSEVMSHAGAAAMVFPLALATARELDVNFTPFAMAIMMAASCGFATPVVYQTNLMVYGPGGYRFADYLRFGGPLNLVVGAVTVALAPRLWPF
ncbi:MAG TPA: SLC13 family permease [Gemmataceae bacterium]|nr:SLC13 family permease [Gemmataceae bacterium]